jgi:hypothetical protein
MSGGKKYRDTSSQAMMARVIVPAVAVEQL